MNDTNSLRTGAGYDTTQISEDVGYALIETHLGLKKRHDHTVIDSKTGRYTDSARYFGLMDAAYRAGHAAAKAETAAPQILKGIGKINGDGWKDTTRKGQVVFVYASELPAPYSPGQYPRVGSTIWSASTNQFDFTPATVDEVRECFESMLEEAAKAETADAKLRTQFAEAKRDALGSQFAEAKRDALGSHDVREPTAIGRAVNRVAFDLPEGWEIRIDLERGAGALHLTDPEGKETIIDGSGEPFSDQINAAIDAAKEEKNGA